MKKSLSLLLSAALLLGLLAGCGSESAPVTEAPVTEAAAAPTEAATIPTEAPTTEPTMPPVTVSEEVTAILTDSEFYYLEDTASLAPYYAEAGARKEAILNTPTEIVKSDVFIPGQTYTGTAHYVSPNGSDDNDGLTPETPLRTLEKAMHDWVESGDIIFLERGQVHRTPSWGLVTNADNVTYSAYGEGEKPILTVVQENSAREECWQLWHEGSNGEKIWQYYQEVGDVAGIVFDDESYAKRIYEWPTKSGQWNTLDIHWFDPAGGDEHEDSISPAHLTDTGEPSVIEEVLAEDLTYVSRVKEPYRLSSYNGGKGPLYLRCDKGNPGTLYQDIEVIDSTNGIYVERKAENFVLDNLSYKYFTDAAIWADGTGGGKGMVIQNCTFEWGAARLNELRADLDIGWLLAGNGIFNAVNDVTVRNNYFYQCVNACSLEDYRENRLELGSWTITGNLIDSCAQGIRVEICNWYKAKPLEAIVIQDNIILNTGKSMNYLTIDEPVCIDLSWETGQYAKTIEISDNVLLGSTRSLIRTPDSDEFEMNIHNNVFAQTQGQILMTEYWKDPIWKFME